MNVTTSVVGVIKRERERGGQKISTKMTNPIDFAWDAEEEEEVAYIPSVVGRMLSK